MSDFKPIETQEELNKIIQEKVYEETEAIKEKYSNQEELMQEKKELEMQISQLQSVVDESKKTIIDYENNVSDLNSKVSEFETANLRTKIAVKTGIPFDLAERLQGNDEESLMADAEKLVSFVSKKETTTPPLKSSEPPLGDGKTSAYRELINNMNLEGE